MYAGVPGAIGATEQLPVCFDSVPDDLALAMRANRSNRVNGAFKTVECMNRSAEMNFERLVVIIPAYVALSHSGSPLGLDGTGFVMQVTHLRFSRH